MTQRSDIHRMSRKKSHSQHDQINISTLQLTDIQEVLDVWEHWFYFKLDNTKYQMVLTKIFDDKKSNPIDTITILHGENTCSFCGRDAIKNGFCKMLMAYEKEIFQKVIPHSKHRLRLMIKSACP